MTHKTLSLEKYWKLFPATLTAGLKWPQVMVYSVYRKEVYRSFNSKVPSRSCSPLKARTQIHQDEKTETTFFLGGKGRTSHIGKAPVMLQLNSCSNLYCVLKNRTCKTGKTGKIEQFIELSSTN